MDIKGRFSKATAETGLREAMNSHNLRFKEITGNDIDRSNGTAQARPENWRPSHRAGANLSQNVVDAAVAYGRWRMCADIIGAMFQ